MRRSALLGLALVLAGCISFSSQGPQRPEPAEPASGIAVAELAIAGTTFTLFEEPDDCLALEVAAPDLQETVERHCFGGDHVLVESNTCGWLVEPAQPGDCDVTLPQVLFGRVIEAGIGHVCVGRTDGLEHEGGVVIESARFVDVADGGFILVEKLEHEVPYAHLFTPEGVIYGEPPLDAPSTPIYEKCQLLAPWGGPVVEHSMQIEVRFGEVLRSDSVVVFLDPGTGQQGVTGGAFDRTEAIPLVFRVPSTSPGLRASLVLDGEPVADWTLEWPADVATALSSGQACSIFAELELHSLEPGGQVELLSHDCG